VYVYVSVCCAPSVIVQVTGCLGNCRLWDFDRDENYLLELSSIGQIPLTAHVTFIDYNKIKGESCSMIIIYYARIQGYSA